MKSKSTVWSIVYVAVGCWLDTFAFGSITAEFQINFWDFVILWSTDSFESRLQFPQNIQMMEILRWFNFFWLICF